MRQTIYTPLHSNGRAITVFHTSQAISFMGLLGTGETSFGFAIAGLLKLNIYTVSLISPMMNDEMPEILLATLPSRRVVLLEDVNCADLTHCRLAGENLRNRSRHGSPSDQPGFYIGASCNTSGVSLSALLNALGGAASPEGKMIIMTTNHVEKLDKALISPDRVHKTVKFSLADTSMTTFSA